MMKRRATGAGKGPSEGPLTQLKRLDIYSRCDAEGASWL